MQYSPPPHWLDLLNRYENSSRIRPQLVTEARSGRYVVFAVDAANVRKDGSVASFNVVETPGSIAMTQDSLAKIVAGEVAQARGTGMTFSAFAQQIQKLGSVDVGVVDILMMGNGSAVRLRQYMIPGKTKLAILTYTCAQDDFIEYFSVFEASAAATKGAYAHPAGIDWSHAFGAGFEGAKKGLVIGAVMGAVVALVLLVKKKRTTPRRTPTAPTHSTQMWECPVCKRRVPNRIDTCRCGASRPA